MAKEELPKKGKNVFFSLKESRDAFVVICATEVEYKEYYDRKVGLQSAIPPYITIVGTLTQPISIMCDFENISHKFFSLPKAMDICFKAYHLFNLEYPDACGHMWRLIDKQFYGIGDANEMNPVSLMLLKDIEGNTCMIF